MNVSPWGRRCSVRSIWQKAWKLPSQAGNYQVYWRVKAVPVGSKSRRHEAQMDGYLLATKAAQLFPS